MKLVSFLGGSLLFAASAIAQDGLTGKYSGRFTDPANGTSGTLNLEITSIKDGAIQGKLIRYTRYCRGEFQMEGTYKDASLELATVIRGGAAGDCSARVVLKADGGKLDGMFNNMPATFTK